ncbi:hypothetical protein Tco_1409812 [Tanacetum coccineum]
MVNVIPPDHVDDVPVVELNQHDDVPVDLEPVLEEEDKDPKEDKFEEEDDIEEEEDDMEEDENEPELTYPYKEVDPLNPLPPTFKSEPDDEIEFEDAIESEDETVPASVWYLMDIHKMTKTRQKPNKTEHEIGKSMENQRQNRPVVEPSTTPRRHHNKKRSQQQVVPTIVEKPVVTMADTRTMAELLLEPTEGNAEAIVVPTIPAEHFELKHSLLNLVTSKQYFGYEKEDPHAHIRWFNKITSMTK